MNRIDALRNEVESILPRSPLDFELEHSRLVYKWLFKIKPDASEALKIAAFSHDIDRAMTGITEKDLVDFTKIDEFKKEHSIRSANFITELMKKHEYDKETIDRVRYLVENHEFGGDDDANTLMDADSIAYFDYNIPHYWKRNGRERTKEKIKFMYKRLSEDAKLLVNSLNFNDREIDKIFIESLAELKN